MVGRCMASTLLLICSWHTTHVFVLTQRQPHIQPSPSVLLIDTHDDGYGQLTDSKYTTGDQDTGRINKSQPSKSYIKHHELNAKDSSQFNDASSNKNIDQIWHSEKQVTEDPTDVEDEVEVNDKSYDFRGDIYKRPNYLRSTKKRPITANNKQITTTIKPEKNRIDPKIVGRVNRNQQRVDRKTTTSKPRFHYDIDYDSLYKYTTENPIFNYPGVKPITANDRPPFTNKPLTDRPSTAYTKPTDPDAITFPEDPDAGPDLIIGRDEDYMSDREKRKYIEITEKMCDKYKAQNTKQLEAIPLLPSPEPVRINVSTCLPNNIPLVVGGKVVTIRDFPHMALLGWPRLQIGGYSWKCGSSLISDQYLLTAAHCSTQERDNSVATGPPRAAQLGSSYLDDPGALVVKVSTVIRHPKYKIPRSYYDIALVKLITPVRFSEVIKPACLGAPPRPGKQIVATGWGRTEHGDQSFELRSVALPVWDMQECLSVLGTSKKIPDGPSSASQVCAGDRRGGKDTCQGDSGGPAQVQDGCVWRVVAVTSLGRGCGAAQTPGLYAIAHLPFIAAHVFEHYYTNFREETDGDSDVRDDHNNEPNKYFTDTQKDRRQETDVSNYNRGDTRRQDIYNGQRRSTNHESLGYNNYYIYRR